MKYDEFYLPSQKKPPSKYLFEPKLMIWMFFKALCENVGQILQKISSIQSKIRESAKKWWRRRLWSMEVIAFSHASYLQKSFSWDLVKWSKGTPPSCCKLQLTEQRKRAQLADKVCRATALKKCSAVLGWGPDQRKAQEYSLCFSTSCSSKYLPFAKEKWPQWTNLLEAKAAKPESNWIRFWSKNVLDFHEESQSIHLRSFWKP